jgi:hypothetical protein
MNTRMILDLDFFLVGNIVTEIEKRERMLPTLRAALRAAMLNSLKAAELKMPLLMQLQD